MEKELIQYLKDFYSDRDMYNQHASPFESTFEIYEKHARRIKEMVNLKMVELVAQYSGHSSHNPNDTCIDDIINEL